MKTIETHVTKNTRAGNSGRLIACPNCGDVTISYHFAWAASGCRKCNRNLMINKKDWIVYSPYPGNSKHKNIENLKKIKHDLHNHIVTYDQAKRLAIPIIKELNTISKKIAKKYSQRPKLISFSTFMR